jgi:serine/threonine protein kinase
MTLERKNGLQLLFHKQDRLDDTVHAMKTLLKRAGQDEALVELEEYLGSRGGKQNQIESSKMFEILNRHLPPLDKGSSMENLRSLAKIETVKELGSGTYGCAYLVKIDGKEGVLKEFGEVEPLSLQRSGRPNEAMGSYLTSKNQPNYLMGKVNIAQPTFYMVSLKRGEKREFQMVNPHEMRSLVKEAVGSGSKVLCHGIVMPKAKGIEGDDLIYGGKLKQSEKKQYIGSMLQSVKGLNERGFVHRDIKPPNSYFDRESETTTLIDTGTLFKTSKNQEKHRDSEYIVGDRPHGTTPYMHPRALQGEDHGTETDLYAVAVSSLQVDHPLAFKVLVNDIMERNERSTTGITKDWLRATLDRRIQEAPTQRIKDALIALRNDIEKPKTLAGFAMKCFEMAGEPTEKWKDREWAQKTYSDLLLHPGLQ